jgi:hypothetical protein
LINIECENEHMRLPDHYYSYFKRISQKQYGE